MRRIAILLLAALVLAACTHGGGSSGNGGKPRQGGTLRIGLERPHSLDPAQARTPAEILLAAQLFKPLTTYDPTSLAVRPGVATRAQASPDQRHWDFFLDPTARFALGAPITPADVKYTLERIARRGSTSSVFFLLEPITGFQAFNDAKGVATELTGITTPAPNVVHFDLDQPLATLPAVLGNPAFGIVSQKSVDAPPPAPQFAEQPTGSGPFRIKSRTNSVLHLVPSSGARPFVSGIEVHLESDDAAAYADFNRGRLDWSPVPLERVEEAAERHGRTGFHPYAALGFYGFNLKSPKFADVRFRQAITAAIDREAIVKGIYNGTVRLAGGLVPEGIPGFQADACGVNCRHDPARAKALLHDAFGDKPVPQIEIDFDQDTTQESIAKAMQSNLKDVGIPSELRPHPYTDYLTFAIRGQQELFRLGWGGVTAYPTADAFLTPLFLGGRHDNLTQFGVPGVDQLLTAGRSDPDEAKRLAFDQQAERAILDQVPVIPLFQVETHSVLSSRVRGLVVTALGTFDASRAWLTSGSGVK